MDYTTSVAYNYNETTKQFTKCYPLTHMNAVYTKDDESETLGNKLADIDNAIDDNVNKIGVLNTSMENVNTQMSDIVQEQTNQNNNIALKANQTDLDSTNVNLTSGLALKRDKATPITTNDIDKSTDANKIHLLDLAEEVQSAIAGTSSVIATVTDKSITSEKYAEKSIRISAVENGLINHLVDIVDLSSLAWESGAIISGTGYKSANTSYIRMANFLKINKGSVLKLTDYTNYKYKVFEFSTNVHTGSNVLAEAGFIQADYVVQNDCYIKVILCYVTPATLSDTSISAYFKGTCYIDKVRDLNFSYQLIPTATGEKPKLDILNKTLTFPFDTVFISRNKKCVLASETTVSIASEAGSTFKIMLDMSTGTFYSYRYDTVVNENYILIAFGRNTAVNGIICGFQYDEVNIPYRTIDNRSNPIYDVARDLFFCKGVRTSAVGATFAFTKYSEDDATNSGNAFIKDGNYIKVGSETQVIHYGGQYYALTIICLDINKNYLGYIENSSMNGVSKSTLLTNTVYIVPYIQYRAVPTIKLNMYDLSKIFIAFSSNPTVNIFDKYIKKRVTEYFTKVDSLTDKLVTTGTATGTWAIGGIATTGYNQSATDRIRMTDYIRCKKGDLIEIDDYATYQMRVFEYSMPLESSITSYSDYITRDYIVQKTGYFKIVLMPITTTTLSDTTISSHLTITQNKLKNNNYLPSYFTPAKTRYALHRGNNTVAPENTIPAFESAGQNGAWGIETDVCTTSDGYYVIFHDSTVDRMTDGTGSITALTYAELQAMTIDAGSNISNYPNLKVPLFEDYLKVCRKYGCVPVIEIKYITGYDKVSGIVDLIKKYGMEQYCMVIGYNLNHLRIVRDLSEKIHVQLLVDTCTQDLIDSVMPLGNCGIDAETITEDLVKYAHQNGMTVNVWVYDSAEDKEMYKNLCVDMITTNTLT